MSTKYIGNGNYATTGYTPSGKYSSIVIGPGGSIGGYGLISGTKASYTITNDGRITGTYVGVKLDRTGLVVNSGLISGASTGAGEGYSIAVVLYGGGSVTNTSSGVIEAFDGVELVGRGTVSNAGTIMSIGAGTYANVGVFLYRGGAVTNSKGALIEAESGVFVTYGASSSGTGVITNAGTIDSTATSGTLAVGAFLGGGGSVTNSGTSGLIEGHIGVEVFGLTKVTNFGTIASTVGVPGTAVLFNSSNDVLVDQAGSRFVGKVIGDGGLLELAGKNGVVNGLGSIFSGFRTADVLAGGSWTLIGPDVAVGTGTSSILDSGVLSLLGTATVAGTVSGTGTLVLAGGHTVLNPGADLSVEHLRVSGGTDSLGIDLAYAGAFAETGGTLALASDDLTLTGTASFSGGTISGSGALITEGAVTLTGLTVTGGAIWDDDDSITISGRLTLGTAGGTGSVTVAAGTILDVTGATGVGKGSSGSITNAGLFEKTGGIATSVVAAGLNDTGTIAITTGALAFAGTSNFDGTISGAGTLEFSGGLSTLESGTHMDVAHILVAAGTTRLLSYDLIYGGGFVESGGTISVGQYVMRLSGVVDFTGGTVTGNGFLGTYAGTSLTKLTLAGGAAWQNFGTVSATGVLTFGGGALRLTIEGDAIYDLTANGGIALAANGSGNIDNAGLLEKTGGTGVSVVAPLIIDTGTVSVTMGTLDFTGAGDSFHGEIGGAGSIEFGGGSSTLFANSLTASRVVLAGKTTELILGTGIAYAGTFVQSGADLVLGGNTLTLSGTATLAGAVTGAGTLALAGTEILNTGIALDMSDLLISGGTARLATSLGFSGGFTETGGDLVIASGKTLSLAGAVSLAGTIAGPGSLTTGGTTALGGLVLDASATWDNAGTVAASGVLTLGSAKTTGKLANLAGGRFDIIGDGGIAIATGGTGTITNAGLFEKTGGTGTSTIAPAIANSGTIAVTAGTLDLKGALGGTGTASIGTSGTLKFDSTVAATETVKFSGSGGGELVLNDPAGAGLGFAGTIDGFGGKDLLDLTSFAFTGKPKLAWAQSGGMGTLTVTDGAKIARITLFGQYAAAGFHTAKDGGAGTAITYTAPAAQIVLAATHH